jgi:hypothetical protein
LGFVASIPGGSFGFPQQLYVRDSLGERTVLPGEDVNERI